MPGLWEARVKGALKTFVYAIYIMVFVVVIGVAIVPLLLVLGMITIGEPLEKWVHNQ